MAAIINHINQNQHRHILTLENPIEFLPSRHSTVP